MNARKKFALPLILAALFFVGSSLPAQAVVRIYKVTYSGKAVLFPKLRNFVDTGFVIYDTANPVNSATIQVFKNKTFQVNGAMFADVFPSQVGLQPADRLPAPAGDTINDTEFALIAFSNGNIRHARSLIGAIPKLPFRIGTTIFVNTAKSLKGVGSLTNPTFDHFTIKEAWTLDKLSASNPADINAGVVLVAAQLAAKGFTQIP
jgi:hypothetical protein